MTLKHFKSEKDVPFHYRPLEFADNEIQTILHKCSSQVDYFYKPSTDQKWIQIGFVFDESGNKYCPTERCGAQCCKEGSPWPKALFPMLESNPCSFLNDKDQCNIQGSKFLCCATAPEPWNDMHNLSKCELRCVEVIDGSDS